MPLLDLGISVINNPVNSYMGMGAIHIFMALPMANRHIVFTLSMCMYLFVYVCMCVCVCVCVYVCICMHACMQA